ncbi:hypothetical protein HY621_01270 [Candidatus Uhrbacteria bacterium]|nr:hypothetical protein [Candidatus Uhrbacteria bacterium]
MIGVFLWSCFVLLGSGVYVLFGITQISSFVILACVICIALFLKKREFFISDTQETTKSNSIISLLIPFLVVVLDMYVVFQIWQVRTDAPLQTPWTSESIWIFAVFSTTTALLVLNALRAYSRWWWVGCFTHFFTFYGVAVIAFRYGFGYDPLIHEAAERYIVKFGQITPLQPYYIGQYAVVAVFHFLTRIPIIYVDRFLVPALASLTLPLVIYHGLFRKYGVSVKRARFFTILFLLIPLSELTFTVPYNLSVLYAIWWIFFLPFFGKSRGHEMTIWGIACVALVTHPLLGMPLIAATLLARMYQRFVQITSCIQNIIVRLLGIAIIACSIVLLFGIHRVLQGELFFSEFSPEGAQLFLSLFKPPEFALDSDPSLKFIYWYEYAIKVVIPLGVFVFLVFRKKLLWIEWISISVLGGILVSLAALATVIRIPGVLAYEQSEFILRLRDTIPWFSFPVLVCGIGKLAIGKLSKVVIVPLALGVGLLASMSLYLSYPQVNSIRPQAGWNVSKYDIEAIHQIEKDAAGASYAVLGTQLFSVTGLREIGFERTHIAIDGRKFHTYAIESKELLFPYASQALYSELSQEIFDSLKAITDLSILYIVVPDSWFRKDATVKEIRALHGKKIHGPPSLAIYRFSL